MVARSQKEISAVSFPQEKYRVVYADLYKKDSSDLGWSPKRKTLDIRTTEAQTYIRGE